MFRSWLTGGMIVLAALGAGAGEAFDHTHTAYARVLTQVVREGGTVDYAGLKNEPGELHRYLRELAQVDADTYRAWSGEQQLAYLINLYNAQTLDLIIRHYPLSSIKDIGTIWRGPWGQPVVSLFGKITTLDNLEHKIIRPVFHDARTHFALVCAARSAPPLRREPYLAVTLEDQLEDQTRLFIRDKRRNRVDVDGAILHLSSIFKWFASDFEDAAGSVEQFLLRYLHPDYVERLSSRVVVIRHLDYDWSLNRAE